jgi:pantetheine-phosphate adenylyltransferase
MKRGLFPGTFDPVTLGHMDIIARAAAMVDELVIGVATGGEKKPIFTLDERVKLLEGEIAPLRAAGHNIRVTQFDTLLMGYAQDVKANVIIRGLRGVSDFDYEFQMAGMNRCLDASVETVFLMAAQQYQFISSRFVKEIQQLGGAIDAFVSPAVAAALARKRS